MNCQEFDKFNQNVQSVTYFGHGPQHSTPTKIMILPPTHITFRKYECI
jgi:hypothetical protein